VTTMGFRVAHLSELASQSGVEGSTWIRVRKHFDIGAFGVNAYRAEEAGGRVIEEHTETGGSAGRHQELYFVAEGRARFSLGEDEVVAPAGTFVFVRDPETRRGAIAEEPRTVVLALGGRPGTPYSVSPWEEFGDAFPAYQAKDYAKAIELFRAALEKFPDSASGLYNLACCESLAGDRESALQHLSRAIELDDQFRQYAQSDDDFDSIRSDRRFPA